MRRALIALRPAGHTIRQRQCAIRHAGWSPAVGSRGSTHSEGRYASRRHPHRQLRLAARRRTQAPRGHQLSRGGERLHDRQNRCARAPARKAVCRIPRPHQADRSPGARTVRPLISTTHARSKESRSDLRAEAELGGRGRNRSSSTGTSAPERTSTTRRAPRRSVPIIDCSPCSKIATAPNTSCFA